MEEVVKSCAERNMMARHDQPTDDVVELSERFMILSKEVSEVYGFVGKLIDRINDLEKRIAQLPAEPIVPKPVLDEIKRAPIKIMTPEEEREHNRSYIRYTVDMEFERNKRQNSLSTHRFEQERKLNSLW